MPALEHCIFNQHCSGLQNCSLKTANREIAVEARLLRPVSYSFHMLISPRDRLVPCFASIDGAATGPLSRKVPSV